MIRCLLYGIFHPELWLSYGKWLNGLNLSGSDKSVQSTGQLQAGWPLNCSNTTILFCDFWYSATADKSFHIHESFKNRTVYIVHFKWMTNTSLKKVTSNPSLIYYLTLFVENVILLSYNTVKYYYRFQHLAHIRLQSEKNKWTCLTNLRAFRLSSHSFHSYDLTMFFSTGWISVWVPHSHFIPGFTGKPFLGWVCQTKSWNQLLPTDCPNIRKF